MNLFTAKQKALLGAGQQPAYIRDGLILLMDGYSMPGGEAFNGMVWEDLSGCGHHGTLTGLTETEASGCGEHCFHFVSSEAYFSLAGDFTAVGGDYTLQCVIVPGSARYAGVFTNLENNFFTFAHRNDGISIWRFPENSEVYYATSLPYVTARVSGCREADAGGGGQIRREVLSFNGNTGQWSKESLRTGYDRSMGGIPGGRWKLGGRNFWNTCDACIYALRLYDRALTQAEIEANHNIDRERFAL